VEITVKIRLVMYIELRGNGKEAIVIYFKLVPVYTWRDGGKWGEVSYARCPDQNFYLVLVPSEYKSEALLL
jgi:hypothetical protein